MDRSWLALVAAVLLVSLAWPGTALASPDTLEVCQSGCAYDAIEDAATDASAGATILVHDGTYECVRLPPVTGSVEAGITLLADRSGDVPELDCLLGPAVDVDVPDLTLEGFDVTRSPDTAVRVRAPGVALVDNRIAGTVEVQLPSPGTVGPFEGNVLDGQREEVGPAVSVDEDAQLTVFRDNVVRDYIDEGMRVEDVDEIVLEDNVFHANDVFGVVLEAGDDGYQDVDVRGNAFEQTLVGLDLRDSTSSLDRVTVRFNQFEENVLAGLGAPLDTEGGSLVDAEYNWWNSPAGPVAGDNVHGSVDFAPWCLTSSCALTPGLLSGVP